MNLIESWKERAKEKYGSIGEGVRELNMILNMKLTPSQINEMSKGKRSVPASVQNMMINDTLLTSMADAGLTDAMLVLTMDQFSELRDKLSLPERKK